MVPASMSRSPATNAIDRTGAVRGAHGALEPAVAVGQVDAHARGPQLRGQHRQLHLGLLPKGHAEHLDPGAIADGLAFRVQRQHCPVDTEAKPDAGQVFSAEPAHQPVVAAAAADTGLRTQPVVHELECGLGVVVQPAHHPRIDHIRHTERVQMREHGLEVLLGDIGEVVEHYRRVGGHLPDVRAVCRRAPAAG